MYYLYNIYMYLLLDDKLSFLSFAHFHSTHPIPHTPYLILHTSYSTPHTPYLEVCWVELFSQHAERFGVLSEVTDIKYSLRLGQVVFLQIVVQTCAWAAEIRDTSSCMCACVCVCVRAC